jgi:arylsulfatase A-like enzyme
VSEQPKKYCGKTIWDYTGPSQTDKYKRPAGMPNIVLMTSDQQRHDTIGALGFHWMQTPGLDRLCREGTVFVNAYSSDPVCIPARHNVLTGLTARHHGMPDLRSHVVHRSIPRMPQILADAGYYCASIGKMHFVPARTPHGFHERQIMGEIPLHPCQDEYLQYLRANGYGHIRNVHGIRNLLYDQPQRSLVPEEHHGTTWVGDRSVEFIKENAWRPFFLWAGWIAPHPPFNAPERWAEMYKGADIPEPAPRRQNPPPGEAEAIEAGDYYDPAKTRRVRELYCGAVSHVDHNVAKILDTLDECGLAENTIIIYTTDHGECLGDWGRWSKMSSLDASCRIPLIVRMPGRAEAGVQRTDFADHNDILPTVLDAAGVDYPADSEYELPGGSLLTPAAESGKDRSVQYSEYGSEGKRWVMWRDVRYKYVHWYQGFDELYDMQEDPQELVNLLNGELTAEQAAVHERLRSQLIAHESRWGLKDHIEGDDFKLFEKSPEWLVGAPSRNWQFQSFPHILPEEERAVLNSEMDEVLQATSKEPALDLARLDLDFYLSAGGDADLVRHLRSQE